MRVRTDILKRLGRKVPFISVLACRNEAVLIETP